MTYQPSSHVLNLLGQNQCPCFVDEKKKAKQLRCFLVQGDNFHCSKHVRVEWPIIDH